VAWVPAARRPGGVGATIRCQLNRLNPEIFPGCRSCVMQDGLSADDDGTYMINGCTCHSTDGNRTQSVCSCAVRVVLFTVAWQLSHGEPLHDQRSRPCGPPLIRPPGLKATPMLQQGPSIGEEFSGAMLAAAGASLSPMVRKDQPGAPSSKRSALKSCLKSSSRANTEANTSKIPDGSAKMDSDSVDQSQAPQIAANDLPPARRRRSVKPPERCAPHC
jgi:hypothetical protein